MTQSEKKEFENKIKILENKTKMERENQTTVGDIKDYAFIVGTKKENGKK